MNEPNKNTALKGTVPDKKFCRLSFQHRVTAFQLRNAILLMDGGKYPV